MLNYTNASGRTYPAVPADPASTAEPSAAHDTRSRSRKLAIAGHLDVVECDVRGNIQFGVRAAGSPAKLSGIR